MAVSDNDKASRHLWFSQGWEYFFLIPDRAVLMPGMDIIRDLHDQKKFVSKDKLAPYQCSADEANQHLYAVWQDSLTATKQAWLDLYNFSQRMGKEIDRGELGKQFQEGLQAAGPQAQAIFSAGRDLVESVVNAAETQHTLSETEQRDVFKHVFSQLPQILDHFDKDSLEAAARNPEAWADNLYNTVFEKSDQEKWAKRKEAMASDIRESIAQGLRRAGMKPSMDWER